MERRGTQRGFERIGIAGGRLDADGAIRLLALVMICLLCGCAAGRPEVAPPGDPILQTALKSIGWTASDLSIRSDRLDDPDRLLVTRRLLEHPIDALQVARTVRGARVEGLLETAGSLLGVRLSKERVVVPDMPENVPEELRDLVFALMVCRARVDAAFAGFSAEERNRLGDLTALVDPKQTRSEGEMDALIALGRRVDKGRLLGAALDLMAALDRFVAHPPVLRAMRFETPIGPVVVGSAGADVFDESAALIVDPGGDDRYVRAASVCIDFAGNDIYTAPMGNGIVGIGVLVDLQGDDQYVSDTSGLGCGVAGIGVLDDFAGDDAYRSGLGAQGFGLYGVGILRDGGGRDQYTGALLVQGAAGPGGAGLLVDASGDDVYEAGGVYPDFREGGRFFQSMAQGFGLGIRPLTSGGVGVLLDMRGDDVYRAAYFGQGAGFWGGAGLLLDRGGRDRYEARRYAQGAGMHLAAGLLVDRSGDDAYTLWGVGQGCGHDLAVGLLCDLLGDDRYDAAWLSQGAGNANGIGWLDDGAGDDRYVAERLDTQGYGVEARAYDSLGLLIDRAGVDVFSGPGVDGALWHCGVMGVGIDWPLGKDDHGSGSGQ